MSNDQIKFEDVQNTFLTGLNNFGEQLQALTRDLQAIEVVTAIGNTTIEISSPPEDTTVEGQATTPPDITDLANGRLQKISGKLTILARTRFELDGDLLVILPTKQTSSLSPEVLSDVELKEEIPTDTSAGEVPAAAAGTPSEVIPTDPTTPNKVSGEAMEIDQEILALHKENVNMAIQNLQFVYGKVMDIAQKFVSSDDKNSILGNIFKLK